MFQLLCKGLLVKEIAAELEITPSTTSNHAARVREKLGVRTNGEVLIYATHHGILG